MEDIGNPTLKEVVEQDNPMKEWLVGYVGEKLNPEDGNVTVEMIVGSMLEEFPEFLMVVAEENWILGYKQAIADVEEGENLIQEEMNKRNSKKKPKKKGKKK
jgi:hypothetical protein